MKVLVHVAANPSTVVWHMSLSALLKLILLQLIAHSSILKRKNHRKWHKETGIKIHLKEPDFKVQFMHATAISRIICRICYSAIFLIQKEANVKEELMGPLICLNMIQLL